MARILMIAVMASLILAQSAYAQQSKEPLKRPQVQPQLQQKQAPKPPREYAAKDLDMLFQALEVAPDADSAKFVEVKILQIWGTSKMWAPTETETVGLLMSRVKLAFEAKNLDVMIDLLTSVIKIAPDFFEARARRAELYFNKQDYAHAMEDIAHVLAREPRHFQALAGLATIMLQFDEDRKALTVFRKLKKIYPKMEKVSEQIEQLERKVGDRDI